MSLRFLGQDIGRRLKILNAGVLELADEVDSKSIASDGVRVQVPPPAPDNDNPNPVPIGDGFGFLVYLKCKNKSGGIVCDTAAFVTQKKSGFL